MSKKEKMLAGMKELLAKAKEAQQDMKTNWAPDGPSRQKLAQQVSESSQRIAQQLKETASTVKKSAVSMKKLAPRLPPPLTEAGLLRVLGSCDIDAGAAILSHYQRSWHVVGNTIQRCAEKATLVDNEVLSVLHTFTTQQQNVTALQQELQHLPAVIESLAGMQRIIASLGKQLTQTEAALERLETTIDQLELENRKKVEQQIFDKHCRAREQELSSLQAGITRAHEQKERQRRRHEQSVLEERRQAFDEVFKEQVKHFKEHGKVETVEVKSRSSTSMEDFHVEDSEGVLENFLSAEDPGTADGEEVTAEDSKEAAGADMVLVTPDADPTKDDDLLKPFLQPPSEPASDSDIAQ